jgi:hypothetical protein
MNEGFLEITTSGSNLNPGESPVNRFFQKQVDKGECVKCIWADQEAKRMVGLGVHIGVHRSGFGVHIGV